MQGPGIISPSVCLPLSSLNVASAPSGRSPSPSPSLPPEDVDQTTATPLPPAPADDRRTLSPPTEEPRERVPSNAADEAAAMASAAANMVRHLCSHACCRLSHMACVTPRRQVDRKQKRTLRCATPLASRWDRWLFDDRLTAPATCPQLTVFSRFSSRNTFGLSRHYSALWFR
jgi:hypothetical protein